MAEKLVRVGFKSLQITINKIWVFTLKIQVTLGGNQTSNLGSSVGTTLQISPVTQTLGYVLSTFLLLFFCVVIRIIRLEDLFTLRLLGIVSAIPTLIKTLPQLTGLGRKCQPQMLGGYKIFYWKFLLQPGI